MHLWTEYEGHTVAEHYTLGKLLRSEGRNGFFATADKDGHAAVIRLTEAHFDEAELLNRWRHVAEVRQGNLIEIDQVGQTTFEGVALTYALMEPDDANLGDVLKERPLTTAETLQVAKAVLAALHALHASGLIHEHIEPRNVLAVGETVKLRSDCVRECLADGEFNTEEACADLRRKDIHDFGALLLRCLTLEAEWSPAHNNLPDPFKRLIPHALDGTWTLEQLGTALDPTLSTPAQAVRAISTPQAAPRTSPPSSVTTPATSNAPTERRPLVPPGIRQPANLISPPLTPPQDPLLTTVSEGTPPEATLRSRFRPEVAERSQIPSVAMWAGLAVAALLLLLLGWHFFSPSKPGSAPPTSSPAPVVSSGTGNPPATASPAASAPKLRAAAPSAREPRIAAGASGWYVIAFTYNHEDQAAEKAKRLRRNHDSLHPQVFTSTGHAPYFVSLGGPMTEIEAEAAYRHARRAGLPRDTFVRHY